MLPSERFKEQWAAFMEDEKQIEASGKPYKSSCKVMQSDHYSKETEDAIIDIANGRQPKHPVMLDILSLGEMIDNVRKYGRDGIYMKTESDKEFLGKSSRKK